MAGYEQGRCRGLNSGSFDSRLWLAAVSMRLFIYLFSGNKFSPSQCRERHPELPEKIKFYVQFTHRPTRDVWKRRIRKYKTLCCLVVSLAAGAWKKKTKNRLFLFFRWFNVILLLLLPSLIISLLWFNWIVASLAFARTHTAIMMMAVKRFRICSHLWLYVDFSV